MATVARALAHGEAGETTEAVLMGILIEASQDNDYPYPIKLTLQCDERDSLVCEETVSFHHQDGYIGAHAAAMADGWLERQSAQGRRWICPACSGK